MGSPNPPPNYLPNHVVLRVVPWLLSVAPMGFILGEGISFMHQYLMHLASLPGTAPRLLLQSGGIPYGQQSVPLVGRSLHACSIYGLGGTSRVPVGSALRAPVPQDTTSTGPHCPDPDKIYFWVPPMPQGLTGDIAPSFHQCEAFWLSIIFIPRQLLCLLFWCPHGGSSFSSSPSPHHHGGSSFSSSHSPCHPGVSLLLLSCWNYGGHGRILILAAYFGGLCFFGHSSVCHS